MSYLQGPDSVILEGQARCVEERRGAERLENGEEYSPLPLFVLLFSFALGASRSIGSRYSMTAQPEPGRGRAGLLSPVYSGVDLRFVPFSGWSLPSRYGLAQLIQLLWCLSLGQVSFLLSPVSPGPCSPPTWAPTAVPSGSAKAPEE